MQFLSIAGVKDDYTIYDNIRNLINDKSVGENQKIRARAGRRGGMYLVDAQPINSEQPEQSVVDAEQKQAEAIADAADKQEKQAEKHYYPKVQNWARVTGGYEQCEITGGTLRGYAWENPDLVAVEYSCSRLTNSLRFDVVSFEVKLQVSPTAVWQAAHYRCFSSEVYVAFAKQEEEVRSRDEGRVFELAIELGLGVLALDKANQFREIHSPRRMMPDQMKVNEFIERFVDRFSVVLSSAAQEFSSCFRIRLEPNSHG